MEAGPEDGVGRSSTRQNSITQACPGGGGMPVTKAPHRVDMTLAREYCPYHPSVVIKKKKLRKDKYIPCYGCLQEDRDAAVANEAATRQVLVATEAALQTEKANVAILRVKNEGMERERVVMDAQMAKLMEQISNLSVELSDALKSNAGYEERLRRVPSRIIFPPDGRSISPTGSDIVQAPGGPLNPFDEPTAPVSESARPLSGSSQWSHSTAALSSTSSASATLLTQDAKAPAPFPLVVEESHGEAETQAASKPVEGPVNGLAGEKGKKPSKMWTLSLPNSKKGKEGDKGQAAGQEEERKGKKGHSKWAMHWGSKGKDKGKQDKARAEEQGEGRKEREERPMSLLDRTQALISTLLSSPHELKRVYLESVPLEQWCIEALCDAQLCPLQANGAALQANGATSQSNGAALPNGPTRADSTQRLFVSEEIEGVRRLHELIKHSVFNHVTNCFTLAKSDPGLLRDSLEVAQLHMTTQKSKAQVARDRLQAGGSEDLERVLRLCAIDDWEAQVVSTLRALLGERVIEAFTAAHVEAADRAGEGLSRVGAMLLASNKLLEDLKDCVASLCPLFPPKFRVKEMIVHAYDDHLTRQALTVGQGDMSDLEVGDLLELRRFLEQYTRELSALGQSGPRFELLEVKANCYQEFLGKTYTQLTEWFTRILEREAVVLFDHDDRPVTSTPEDLLQIIRCQLDIASAGVGLEGSDLVSFVLIVLSGLRAFVAEHLHSLHTTSATKTFRKPAEGEVVNVAACINDYDRLQDLVSELRDELFHDGKLGEEHVSSIDPVIEQLREEVVRVCLEANGLVCVLVLRDATSTLRQASPFDDKASRVVDEALLTFRDYFDDLRTWLPAFFFPLAVRRCFEGLVALYVLGVLRGANVFADYRQVAHEIRQHKGAICVAMEGFKGELEQAGVPDLQKLVVVLDDLADVVDKGVQIRSPWTGYLLRDLPPPWNVDALLHLQTLRGDLLPADKKKARAKLLEWYDGEVGPWSAGGGAASTSASRSAATSTLPSSATATAASGAKSGGSGWKSALASFKHDAPSPALPPQPHYQPPPSITPSAALLWNVRESPINPDVAGDALLWDVALSPAV